MKEFSISTGLTARDFRKLAYWNMFGKDKKALLGIALMAVSGALCIVFGNGNMMITIIGAALLLCPFLSMVMAESGIRRAQKTGLVQTLARQEYLFTETGIRAGEGNFYEYARMGNVYETPEFVVIFVNRIQMLAIARRDLSPTQQKRVKEALRVGKFGK